MGFREGQSLLRRVVSRGEILLDKERGQLPLWLPVAFGLGIGLWFVLPTHEAWLAVQLIGIAFILAGLVIGWSRRLGHVAFWFGLMMSLGNANIWVQSEMRETERLSRPTIAQVSGVVERVEHKAEIEQIRLWFRVDKGLGLPERVRLSFDLDAMDARLIPGGRASVRARLMPPAEAAIPGGYDFARSAWFLGLGATGKAIGPLELQDKEALPQEPLRQKLSAHIRSSAGEEAGGIAAALAAGDQGYVSKEDQHAMRTSGLAHLLSISGLHITAVIAAVILATMRLLALSQRLALRVSLPLVAAAIGALAGIGYTLLAGAEVPTIRSCVAALLVLTGLAIGREAMTLRLVAVGALVILLLWPQALVGPSFQLSFAAITALVALHEWPAARRWLERRQESFWRRIARGMLGLLLSGIVVELALIPVAMFHFHKAGVYGALANIIAIPLTTFIVMPLEALALLFDLIGIGAPFWWLTGQAISALLGLSRWFAALPGAVAMIPETPLLAYAAIIGGGVWLTLWRTKMRRIGFAPLAIGGIMTFTTPPPDLLVTGDGRHVVIRGENGQVGILRSRAGDYVRDTLAERSGVEAVEELDTFPEANCSDDSCIVDLNRGGRVWRILATRSAHYLPWQHLIATCATADIVISDRALPQGCRPRWMIANPKLLRQSGGLAITLSPNHVSQVKAPRDDHPWLRTAHSIQ